MRYISPYDPLVTFSEFPSYRPIASALAVIEGEAREALAVLGDTAVYRSMDARIERHGDRYVTSFAGLDDQEHDTLVSAMKTFLLFRRRRCWSCGQSGCGGVGRRRFVVEPLPPETLVSPPSDEEVS
jgi:hypothetical protein